MSDTTPYVHFEFKMRTDTQFCNVVDNKRIKETFYELGSSMRVSEFLQILNRGTKEQKREELLNLISIFRDNLKINERYTDNRKLDAAVEKFLTLWESK